MKRNVGWVVALGVLVGGVALAQESQPQPGATPPPTSGPTNAPPAATPGQEPPLSTETGPEWAQTPELGPHGFEIGFRLGYAWPMGDAVSGTKLSDITSGMFPLQADLGWRITPTWYVGGYFQYGFLFVKDTFCPACSGGDMRFGLDLQYHLMPDVIIDPWAGIGAGYEIFHLSADNGSDTLRGWEFVNLQLGVDYKLAPTLGVGPVLGLAIGQFDHETTSVTGQPDLSQSIGDKGTHLWLTLGVRSVFDLM